MRVLLELAIFVIVLVAANFVATLVFPDPFPVQLGHTYTGEEARKLIEASQHQGWLSWLVIIVVYIGMTIWKSRGPRYRRRHAAAT